MIATKTAACAQWRRTSRFPYNVRLNNQGHSCRQHAPLAAAGAAGNGAKRAVAAARLKCAAHQRAPRTRACCARYTRARNATPAKEYAARAASAMPKKHARDMRAAERLLYGVEAHAEEVAKNRPVPPTVRVFSRRRPPVHQW